MKIWIRHLMRKMFAVFGLALFGAFILYVLVDLSLNGVKLLERGKFSWLTLSFYYGLGFGSQLPLFLSFSFLLAILKVLFDFASSGELVALQMAGVTKGKLLVPFFAFAAGLTLIGYANEEWFLPKAHAVMGFSHKKQKKSDGQGRENVHNLSLSDGTEIVYQRYNEETKELFDLFWIKSQSEVWCMKYLRVKTSPVEGLFVDHLVRNEEGLFEKESSFERKIFEELPWNPKTSLQAFVPFEYRPLLTLFEQAQGHPSDRGPILAHLHTKLALPLAPLLVLFSVFPMALRFERRRPRLLISALVLFGLVAFFAWMGALLILGENQVASSALLIWGSMGLFFSGSLVQYIRKR